MRRFSITAFLSIGAVLCFSTAALAQTSVADKFLISAKAGGVNDVEGLVTVVRANGTAGVLLKRDRVEVGDRVTTGSDGRAEVLLNPGSYIRLAANSSFEFGTTDLEDLQLKLDAGSAIFEVFAADEFRVSIFTPKGKVSLVETGVYRVDVGQGGNALLSVTKGKAEVGESSTVPVKEGRAANISSDAVAVTKFDKKKLDEFGKWSKDRSKELAKVSSSLKDRSLSTAIMSGFNNRSWSIYNSFGLWIFDASFGGYCFLPFGTGWRSPYGSWYHNGIWWRYMPYYFPPRNPNDLPNSGTGSSHKVNGRTPPTSLDTPVGKVSSREPIRSEFQAPPFTRIDRGTDFSGRGSSLVNTKSDFDNFGGGRSTQAPSYSPPPIISPPASDSSSKSSSRNQ